MMLTSQMAILIYIQETKMNDVINSEYIGSPLLSNLN